MASGIFTLKQQELALGQGAWTNQPPISVNYLVVAGGGGGGANGAGGGGGGLLQGSFSVIPGTSYTVTVGAGGNKGVFGSTDSGSGGDSVFATITSTGGGRGASAGGVSNGSAGGSGGGSRNSGTAGSGTSGQGNAGGSGVVPWATDYGCGGGGGAGTVGAAGATTFGGNGGAGVASDISGTRTTYAGGGGGGVYYTRTAGTGGAGGGGSGGSNGAAGTSGGANTGGGGGGGGSDGGNLPDGGTGGSGIVIISYPGTTQWFTGGTLSYANGNVIHTFYSSGTLAPTAASNYVNTDYQITRSLRFNSADSAYLNWTPGSAGNRKTWTFSFWTKKTIPTGYATILSSYTGGASTNQNTFQLYLDNSAGVVRAGGVDWGVSSLGVLRDPSSWYHIVVVLDTTQPVSTDRVKIYINGVNNTNTGGTYPVQNETPPINTNGSQNIGRRNSDSDRYMDGYVTEVNMIDGQALTPSSFGYYNPNTGVWSPLKFVGTYGTNGFYLNFSDNSNTTAATLGKDYSGNGNNWTPNNFSVTAGAGNDSLVDSPTAYGTDTGVGGEVRGNYATWNPLFVIPSNTTNTFANGNLEFTVTQAEGTGTATAASTMALPTTGKWYWEITPTTVATGNAVRTEIGIMNPTQAKYLFANDLAATDCYAYAASGVKVSGQSQVAYGNSYTDNDVIGVAVDLDNGAIYFAKNNTWQNSGVPTSGASKTGAAYTTLTGSSNYLAAVGYWGTYVANFGQRPFAYTAPSGFKALCTQNLPTPTIGATATTRADDYFNTVLYTGNSNGATVSGVGFQPDFVWMKCRSTARNHELLDAVRGGSSTLFSNLTNAQATQQRISSFNADGFTYTTDSNSANTGDTFVAWNWKANGAGSSNTAGTISSTVSANTTAGFSIVTYTGNGTSGATVGHGCLVNGAATTPEMLIFKNRDATDGWIVFQKYVGGTDDWWDTRLLLASTAARADNAGYLTAAPTSTLLTLSNTSPVNTSSQNYLIYCFAPVAGYSAFGSYTGNGSTDGPFIYTGFRPRYVLIKRSSAAGESWFIHDTARSPYNVSNLFLAANLDWADTTAAQFDILSNGIKIRESGSGTNTNGDTYIYAAFAESPFKYALAR